MSRLIAFKDLQTNQVVIRHPLNGTPEENVSDLEKNNIQYYIIEDTELPTHNCFRDSWELDANGCVCENLDTCKNIFKDIHVRPKRDDLLKKLDVLYIRALEQNKTDSISLILTDKQELRDLTSLSSITNALSSDELLNTSLNQLEVIEDRIETNFYGVNVGV